jgi:DNA-binding response OmpR family regulator
MTHVLIVEDAPEAAELATALLRNAGYTTSTASSGSAALDATRAVRPDLILLDLGLPDIDGTDLCRQLREVTDAYVLMLTARDDEVDKVLGLKLGADDYVTKPYSPRELLARIEALLRRDCRRANRSSGVRRIGELLIDPEAHRVSVGEADVAVTRTEFALLDALSERPGRVMSREALQERVWGAGWLAGNHVLDTHMANLRKKLGPAGRRHLRTVRGVGYQIVEHSGD